MIDRELRGRHPLAAVLALAIVPKKQIAPVRPQQAAGDLDVGKEANDDNVLTKATPRHCLLDRLPGIVVNEGDALLGQQDDQPPLTDHIQRLK
jgi:hypothetical protein